MEPPSPPAAGVTGFARSDPERVAFVAGERRVTYRELDDASSRAALALRDRGVGTGDRVAIMLPNDVDFFKFWAAAAKLEAAVVLVNFHLKADELVYILEDSQARVLVAHERLRSDFEPAVARSGCELIVVGGKFVRYAPAVVPEPIDPAASRLAACEVLATPVFYTSGTTGRPKGVVHGAFSGDRVVAAQTGQVALWGWTSDDAYILSGPAYHAGPGGYVMSALFVGASSVIMQPGSTGAWDRVSGCDSSKRNG